MKIYISLPITGHDLNEVRERCWQAAQKIREAGHTPVSPLEVSPDPDAPYDEHIANDIKALLGCDAAVFLDGYSESKGCALEMACARIYNKEILFEKQFEHGLEQISERSLRDRKGTRMAR